MPADAVDPTAEAQRDGPDSSWLRGLVGSLGQEMGDGASPGATSARAAKLWVESGLPADRFAELVHETRSIAQRQTGRVEHRRPDGCEDKAPYSFKVPTRLPGERCAVPAQRAANGRPRPSA